MAAAPRENLGRFPCPNCREPVALKRSATLKLSFVCDDADCEISGYANPNTGAARAWLAKVSKKSAGSDPLPLVVPQPAPKPIKPAPVPQTTPAPVQPQAEATKTAPRPVFGLADLLTTRKV